MERPSELAAGGPDEADLAPTFEDLFSDHHERLFRALYLIVGSSFEAEELMQDAFLGVYERWDRIDNPVGYLYRTALNATRSRFKRLTLAAKRTVFYDVSIKGGEWSPDSERILFSDNAGYAGQTVFTEPHNVYTVGDGRDRPRATDALPGTAT